MKLKDLKEFLETLTEDQLEQDVTIMGDYDQSFAGGDLIVKTLDEDYYYSDEGCFPVSSIDGKDLEEFLEDGGGEIAWNKGRVFFYLIDPTTNEE